MFQDLAVLATTTGVATTGQDWHVLTSYGASGQTLLTGALAEQAISIPNTIMLAISTALVLLMVPGLAIFYAGLVRRKNVSTVILQTIAPMLITGLIWFLFGFSLAFGSPTSGGFIGNIGNYALLRNVIFANGFSGGPTLVVNTTLAAGVPFILYFLFQGAFAIITPSLVVGAFADRLSWKGFIFFNVMFTLFVYIPVCNWIFGGGFLAQDGTIDWAGGIVIHTTCGAAAVASVIVLRRRAILRKESTKPHSIPLVVIGGALLFFGWFGFNTGGGTYIPLGSAVPGQDMKIANLSPFIFNAANVQSHAVSYFYTAGVSAFSNTAIATMCGIFVWVIFDWGFNGKPTTVGAITGGVAGLATITPAAGFIPIWASVVVGVAGAVITYACCKLNHAIHFDDALEVWPVHGIGGIVGALLAGAFASIAVNPTIAELNGTAVNDPYAGIVFSNTQIGSGELFGMEAGAIALTIGWTMLFMIGTFLIIKYLMKGEINAEQQIEGVDAVVTGEEAYGSTYNVEPILLGEGDELENPHHDAHDHTTSECVEILSAKIDDAVFARNSDPNIPDGISSGE